VATQQSFESQIDEAIKSAIMTRLRQVCDAEIKKAQEAIETQLRVELAQIVLAVFKMYRVERGHSEILIRVENKESK
jgi:GH15 family glucan-1,4-alpha-glucosidase